MITVSRNVASNAKPARSPISRTFNAIWTNWMLAREMAKRELMVSNKGALLGIAWLLIRPFIQVAALVVVVSFVFGVRFEHAGGRFGYAVYVLAGMVPWQILSKALEEAPSLVRDRVEILKQVVYPLEILPVTSLLSAMIGPSIAFVVYVLLAAINGGLHWSILLVPIPMLLLFAFVLGSAWALMMVGVLLKDLREITSVILGLLVYMSPVVMSEQMTGPAMWSLLQFNPFFHVIASFRDVFDATFHPVSWIIFAAMTVAALALGIFVLDRARALLNELI
jgi:lipopolysaccharide transport system permease protein